MLITFHVQAAGWDSPGQIRKIEIDPDCGILFSEQRIYESLLQHGIIEGEPVLLAQCDTFRTDATCISRQPHDIDVYFGRLSYRLAPFPDYKTLLGAFGNGDLHFDTCLDSKFICRGRLQDCFRSGHELSSRYVHK